MERIAVVGSGGAGKSTFSSELGERLGLPVHHLDEHFWQPGWVETQRSEWRVRQEELFDSQSWIADGNYGGTLDVRLSRADTVIVLAPPRVACLWGAIRRTVKNRGTAIQAPGCPERFDLAFLIWIWRYPKNSRPRLDAAIREHKKHLAVIELKSRADVRGFLHDLR